MNADGRMRTLLITGAAKGIGRAIAEAAAARGYNVVVNYNTSAEAAAELAERLGKITGALAVRADVSDAAAVDGMFAAAERRFGKVTDVVNNAGVSWTGLLTDMDEAEYAKVIDTNLKGMVTVTKRAVPAMVARGSGTFVNVSSVWGRRGASCEAVYSATKAAVIGFTEAVARELGPSGIRANAVCPGVTDTHMLDNLSAEDKAALADEIPLGRLGTPEDVAAAVMFLLSADSAYVTGQTLTVDGGFL